MDSLPVASLEGCDGYVDNPTMREKWRALADSSYKDFDVVYLSADPVGDLQHRSSGSRSAPVVWAEWPASTRPEILVDLICDAAEKRREDGAAGASGTSTADAVAEEAIAALRAERIRQTNVSADSCCVIRAGETDYWVHYGYFHIDRFDGPSIGDRDLYRDEGTIDLAVQVDGRYVPDLPDPLGFYVKPSAKLIHIELRWASDLGTLDLLVRGPGSGADEWEHVVSGDDTDAPPGRLKLTIWREDTEAWRGDWNVTVAPSGVVWDAEYEIAVTRFNWSPVLPAGYTAFS